MTKISKTPNLRVKSHVSGKKMTQMRMMIKITCVF